MKKQTFLKFLGAFMLALLSLYSVSIDVKKDRKGSIYSSLAMEKQRAFAQGEAGDCSGYGSSFRCDTRWTHQYCCQDDGWGYIGIKY